jgi:hypothetical protein
VSDDRYVAEIIARWHASSLPRVCGTSTITPDRVACDQSMFTETFALARG